MLAFTDVRWQLDQGLAVLVDLVHPSFCYSGYMGPAQKATTCKKVSAITTGMLNVMLTYTTIYNLIILIPYLDKETNNATVINML